MRGSIFTLSTTQNQPQALIGLGLARHVPTSVWSGTISSIGSYPSDGTGIGQLSVTGVSGSSANVQEGMTVVLTGDNSITYTTYCRKAPTSTVLYIDGLGATTVPLTGGGSSSFAVYSEYLAWPRRFRYASGSTTWFCNFDTTYTDQNENFEPQPLFGPAAVIYKNGSVSFSFDATRSVAWTSGATIASYAWTFPDATTSTSATPTWTTSTAYPNGAYVDLTVTDSNGKTGTTHRLIFKFDSTHLPKTDFEVTRYEVNWAGGLTVEIKSGDQQLLSTYKGVLHPRCVLFGTTAYAGSQVDIGGNMPNRGNIWFDGFIMNSHIDTDVDGDHYTYTLQTVDAILQSEHGFALVMDNNAGSPTTWLTMKTLTLDNIGWHYARWRSTLSLMTDVYACGNTLCTRTKLLHSLDTGTMWDQLVQNYSWQIEGAQSPGCVSVDTQGAIYFEQNAQISATQSSLPNLMTFCGNAKTVMRADFVRDQLPASQQVETVADPYPAPLAQFIGYGVDSSTPIGSRAPDDPVAHGGGLDTVTAGLMETQTEMNLHAGQRRADTNTMQKLFTVPLVGIIRIEPTPQCTVTSGPEGTFTNGIVRALRITFDHDHGMAASEIDVEVSIGAVNPVGATVVFTS